MTRLTKMSSNYVGVAVTFAWASILAFATAAPASAACGNMPNACLSGPAPDGSTMAGVTVDHWTPNQPFVDHVQPDDTDTWEVVATHSTDNGAGGTCQCHDFTSSVAGTVTWNGSSWSVGCTGCDAVNGPIMSLGVCAVDGCVSPARGWKYRLTARVVQTRPDICFDGAVFNDAYLTAVAFTTTSVDDGDVVSSCGLGASVSPISQTWGAGDNAFDCNLNCGSVNGPNIAIEYQ